MVATRTLNIILLYIAVTFFVFSASPQTERIKQAMHSTAESGTYGQGRPDTNHIKAGMPITKINSPSR